MARLKICASSGCVAKYTDRTGKVALRAARRGAGASGRNSVEVVQFSGVPIMRANDRIETGWSVRSSRDPDVWTYPLPCRADRAVRREQAEDAAEGCRPVRHAASSAAGLGSSSSASATPASAMT